MALVAGAGRRCTYTVCTASSNARWPRATPLREHPTAPTPVGRLIHPLRRSSSVGECVCVTFVTLECVRARVWLFFAISSECRSVCVALVAGAGRRCTYTVCTYW